MNKILITGCAVATAFAAAAMPTKQELAQAQKPVENATKADLAALKAGQKTAKDVAESHLALAAKAENQAEKYLYYQGAFKLYARCREYSRAIDTLGTLKRNVKDVTPEVIDELVGQELRGVAVDKAEVAGDMGTASDVKWTYQVVDGGGVVLGGNGKTAVPKSTAGALEIPAVIDGKPVRGIGSNAFCGCDKLSSVTMPSSVRSIDAWAFKDCTGLKLVTIPEGVACIGESAFQHCHALKSVTIPKSVTNIEPRAFLNCAGLTSVNVDQGNPVYKSVGGMVLTKDGKTLFRGLNGVVKIPEGVTNIGVRAFCCCGALKSVTIPEGVTSIEMCAFSYCGGLRALTIPATVKRLGEGNFWRCYELTSLTFCGERPDTSGEIFGHCGKLKAIHVPATAKSWAGMKEWQGIPLVFDAK